MRKQALFPKSWQIFEGSEVVHLSPGYPKYACKQALLHPILCNPSAKLPCPWNFPGKNTRGDCHFLLQGIFPTQGLNLHVLHLKHCRQILYHWVMRSPTPGLLQSNLLLPPLPPAAPLTCQRKGQTDVSKNHFIWVWIPGSFIDQWWGELRKQSKKAINLASIS